MHKESSILYYYTQFQGKNSEEIQNEIRLMIEDMQRESGGRSGSGGFVINNDSTNNAKFAALQKLLEEKLS